VLRIPLLVLFLALSALSAPATPAPRNVILLIADGAGPAHYSVMRHDRGADFQIGRMPVIGLMATSAANRAVTDSAAGATALAIGVKTNYEMVGVSPDGTRLPSVLQRARALGKRAGLVTTAPFWDATPAAFLAYASHRGEYVSIMRQILGSGVELIASGGLEYLGVDGIPSGSDLAREYGYTLISSASALESTRGARLLALFPSEERDVDHPAAPLPRLTGWAIEQLAENPEGFFLVVEHEGVDSASHENHAFDVRRSLISFDEAIGVALDFAASRSDTLVIVTSDHETGGLRLTETRRLGRLRLEWSTTDHTATLVPLFAFGPGAEAFGTYAENHEMGLKLRRVVLGEEAD
jgi:alkaline phosphatase